MTTSSGDEVVVSADLNRLDSTTHIGRAKMGLVYSPYQFFMLDYDCKYVKFTQMSANDYQAAAIDSEGELWFIGGLKHRLAD